MSDIIEEKEIPMEEEEISTDAIDYDESIEEDIVLSEWDKDEYEAEAEAEPETH